MNDNYYNEFKYEIISETKDAKEKQKYWNIAFGLQDVDDLKPSKYMVELAKDNVKGKNTYNDIYNQVTSYYEKNDNTEEKEADLVSLKIVQMLNNPTFRFDYNTLKHYHKYLFDGLDIGLSHKYIGSFRDYNITKKEPILNGDTVLYVDYHVIKDSLEYDFDEEARHRNYAFQSHEEIIQQLSRFTSHIWQVHPFGERNTRTTALFIQKYIMFLGLKDMNNEIFKDYSKFFRNALVRANYNNISIGVQETNEFLNKFFGNLLFDEGNELNNEELCIKRQ